MGLAEKIGALRIKSKLSQGDLAEKIGVSRQSVSKWETGASVPDLEKIIRLAHLFGVTVDDLVNDTQIPDLQQPFCAANTVVAIKWPVQQIVAACLLLLSGVTAVFGFAFLPSLLFLAAYFLGCSLVCFVIKRGAGLVISWVTFLAIAVLSPYLLAQPIFSALGWVGLAVTTVWAFAAVYKNKKRKP